LPPFEKKNNEISYHSILRPVNKVKMRINEDKIQQVIFSILLLLQIKSSGFGASP
jgi:hypothetical protein